VTQELGVALELGAEGVARCIDEAGLGFMYAPRYHTAMRLVRPVRASLKVRQAGQEE
jgi:anthranilate phosphoribosyltransferase